MEIDGEYENSEESTESKGEATNEGNTGASKPNYINKSRRFLKSPFTLGLTKPSSDFGLHASIYSHAQAEYLERRKERELQRKVLADLKKHYSLSSSPVLVDAANTLYDSFMESINDDPIEDESTLSASYQTAHNLAESLHSKYNVSVVVLDTDADFYSEDSIKKSIHEDTYFVSAESPEETAKISEHLIKFQQLKFRLMIEAATAKRIEHSTANNLALKKTIDEITGELLAAKPKKKPALSKIAEILNDRGVAAPRGKESKWHAQTVKRILRPGKNDAPSDMGQTR